MDIHHKPKIKTDMKEIISNPLAMFILGSLTGLLIANLLYYLLRKKSGESDNRMLWRIIITITMLYCIAYGIAYLIVLCS